MKNWLIVLLIFILPLSLYAYLDAKAQNAVMCKAEGNKDIASAKVKIIKFSSPMCSECKEAQIEMSKALKDYKEGVIVEEINVLDNTDKGNNYNKTAIKKYKITLVPTLVFVDKQGNAVKKHEGAMKKEDIIKTLDGIQK